MEKSKNFGFNLPSRDADDVADINFLSENFRKIDTELSGVLKGEGIDQSYNPKSQNAQSGTAVAEAVANRVPLDAKTEWIFDGGNASGSVGLELIIDNEMSGESDNLVPNKVIKQYVDKSVSDVLLSIYPIGSVYISINHTDPATMFGGVWERIKDKFLLSCGDEYAAGSMGGEATHTLMVEELPTHTHGMLYQNPEEISENVGRFVSSAIGYGRDAKEAFTGSNYITYTGENMPHNNMPPYLAVYMWQRIG